MVHLQGGRKETPLNSSRAYARAALALGIALNSRETCFLTGRTLLCAQRSAGRAVGGSDEC